MGAHRHPAFPAAGFTLVELVLVIALTGIVAVVGALLIVHPIQAYRAQANRAALVALADGALRLALGDIRRALPNSIRLNANPGTALEMINTANGGRYRDGNGNDGGGTNHNGALHRLQFNAADDSFDAMGLLNGTTSGRAVIYNAGVPGADAYENANVITPAATTVGIATEGQEFRVTLSSGFQFAFESPRQRIFFVDTAIGWLCDVGAGTLTRHTYTSFDTTPPPANFGAGALVTRYVSACAFHYDAGTSSRAGLVTLVLTLTREGESVTLLRQAHVDNAP